MKLTVDTEKSREMLFDPKEEHDACGVGFVVNTKGVRSNKVLKDAKVMLERMDHRGACACDEDTGDGSGVMTSIPYEIYLEYAREANVVLPPMGQFATGIIFVQAGTTTIPDLMKRFSEITEECGLKLLFWRMVDVNKNCIGVVAHSEEPIVVQVFVVKISPSEESSQGTGFRSQVFLLRKYASNELSKNCYICSLCSERIVYKGLFTTKQLWNYYADLSNPNFLTHFAIVHNRFSTNTFPSWSRAHPQRMMAHNGEINTLRGNVNYCRARQSLMFSRFYTKAQMSKLFPIIEQGMSDSGSFDNMMEFLCQAGDYSLPEAVMMMIPEAWHNFDPDKDDMSREKWNYFKWAANSFEPWDGPALIVFSDGRYIGAILDRNGLRPARFYATDDDMVYMSSEVGVVDIQPDVKIIQKGRLKAGRLLIVDTESGQLLDDESLKSKIATKHPYDVWLKEGALDLSEMHKAFANSPEHYKRISTLEPSVVDDRRLPLFGYNPENINLLILPMLKTSKEALGSMGNDAPLACLSEQNPHVFDYFQQLFAQVTNPPIDPFRERIVMTLMCPIGPQKNILIPSRAQTHRLWLNNPILSLKDMALLRSLGGNPPSQPEDVKITSTVLSWRSVILDATLSTSEGSGEVSLGSKLFNFLQDLCDKAENAVLHDSVDLLVISDRASNKDRLPVPILLAVGAVHQRLIRRELRMRVGIIVETGESKEVHHFCTLIGFGADAICPYLIFESVSRLNCEGLLTADTIINEEELYSSFIAAVERGILKVMAKMGISTLHSYKSAQIFEAVGLAQSVIDMCFCGTVSRVGGADFEILAREVTARHRLAYPECQTLCTEVLENLGQFGNNPGFYHWRYGGEKHINSPETIAKLQAASRNNSQEAYKLFVEAADECSRYCTLRGQLDFNYAKKPLPLDLVEPAADIVKRFSTGAMSLGSISSESHTALARAMNKIGGRSNTGEGGERPERYKNPEICSAIKQVASARFGVNSSYLAHAEMLQIKMAQGAKPGEGGELPGYKVTEEIALTRYSVPGVGLISPPPHHDIYSIEDLAQLIYDLKAANPFAIVSVKLVSEVGVGVVAAGVAKARAAHITISGHDGGTGASSWTGIKHAGLPWELGIAETHQCLTSQQARSRVKLQVDGQIRTGRDVIIACILGADEFAMSTAPLIVLGCTMMRKCHLNTCPVGIATQDPVLRKKFAGSPEHVINYLFLLAEEVRQYLSRLGVSSLKEIVGHTEYLKHREFGLTTKSQLVDLSRLMMKTEPDEMHYGSLRQSDSVKDFRDNPTTLSFADLLPADRRLDIIILRAAHKLLDTPADMELSPSESVVRVTESINNSDRTVGTTLSYAISTNFAEKGLPSNRRIIVNVRGSAGQSFGAFLARGVHIRLEGDGNDYVGKGLSGGQITIVPPQQLLKEGFISENNIIVGNVCLYGAIEGRLFLRGQAAERFCVRNSGATVVVEGCGDHGCEYMTGGRAVILGRTGRNFAAGMSGGLAFIYDPLGMDGDFVKKCNMELVDLETMNSQNVYSGWLKEILVEFVKETDSQVGSKLLADWDESIKHFVLVFPRDYKNALAKLEASVNAAAADSNAQQSNTTVNSVVQSDKVDGHDTQTTDIEDVAGDEPTEKLDKVRGFVKYARQKQNYRPVEERIKDWDEVYALKQIRKGLVKQAARCMDCGVPFCQSYVGCPLGNLIPNWNDLVFKGDWHAAHIALAQTNNFPEFTGRVCPAPCEGACVLGINSDPVTIKHIECTIADKAWENGWLHPIADENRMPTGKRIAVVGSGPSGLACADQLNKVGHDVTVIERRNLPGGLLRYGIPTMKLSREVLNRRLNLMKANGVKFALNTRVAHDGLSPEPRDLNSVCRDPTDDEHVWPVKKLLDEFDAIVLCLGATWPRDLNIPGRQLEGIHFAMSFLERWQRHQHKNNIKRTYVDLQNDNSLDQDSMAALAKGKRVVILGGGDTGVDCIATSVRQGAEHIRVFEILPPPPASRDINENPWPEWPRIWRVDYGHSEVAVHINGDPRQFNTITKEFLNNGKGSVCGIRTAKVEWTKSSTGKWIMSEIPDSEETFECDLVLLAMGFIGPETTLAKELELNLTSQSVIQVLSDRPYTTHIPKVYAAGDCRRGQSLVVHAINEGRLAARQVDLDLMGKTQLPGPGGIIKSANLR
ncbi:glutamate synthase [NADPH] [Schistosoma japonicum]|nr:glutamate synthase [NADPH] [Schistosoma japonicum]